MPVVKRIDKETVPESVSIVAMGFSCLEYIQETIKLADRTRLTEETWIINALGGVIQYDLLFHMDDCRVQEARAKENPDWNVGGMMRWLKGARFITSKAYPDYPGAMEFPLKAVADNLKSLYFNSTPAYALGYAIAIGVQKIHLYGLDYTYPDKHKAEKGRACIEYLCGIAKERGIDVFIPKTTTLFDANVPKEEKPYGYDAYHVHYEVKDGEFQIDFEEKDLPSAAEIETRYRNLSIAR